MKLNKIYNENCLDTMARMETNFLDMTITSPPYDNIRAYNGYSFDFENIARELFRVTNAGGVVVWVVGDATIKGGESGTSFKQALYFIECGFKLHDTMIYRKLNPTPAGGSAKRYKQCFEYMFVFSNGTPKTFNPIRIDCENTKGFVKCFTGKVIDGVKQYADRKRNSKKNIDNIFEYNTVRNKETKQHPAVFPEKLAEDHIISWSNEGDLVYDPFMGSGTTAKMAIKNNRYYIGSEISSEYCEIANTRIGDI